jgi:ubiquitin related modifier 1
MVASTPSFLTLSSLSLPFFLYTSAVSSLKCKPPRMSETYKLITVALSGGCELLFNNEASLFLSNVIPVGTSVSLLIALLKQNYIQERPELFVDASGTNVRPGILVLVNGCDVEVMGGVEHVLEEGDEVEFISTLHGG